MSGLTALAGPSPAADIAAALTRHFGATDLLLTESGTAALTLALRAAAPAGEPVALPAYCCFDIATAADGALNPVILYDLDPKRLTPDERSLRRALERGARAVVLVHLYGIPVDVEAVAALAAPYGATVIEDAAQGTGATVGGRPAGSAGSLGVLSFGRGKGVTGGRGGALLANNPRAAAALHALDAVPAAPSSLREVAVAAAQLILARPSLYALPSALPFLGLGQTVYHPARLPRAISRFALGMLRRTLALAGDEAMARRRHAIRLRSAVEGAASERLRPIEVPQPAAAGFLRLPVLASPQVAAAVASDPTARRLGVMPGYPRALCDLPGFGERLVNGDELFPGARRLAAELLTLPTHSRLTEADLVALEGWARRTGRSATTGSDQKMYGISGRGS
jgi:perosamine synthetase